MFFQAQVHKHMITLISTPFFFSFFFPLAGGAHYPAPGKPNRHREIQTGTNRPSSEQTPQVRLSLLKALNIYKSPGKHDFNAEHLEVNHWRNREAPSCNLPGPKGWLRR